MEPVIGIVCGRCESYAPLGDATCSSCTNVLALEAAVAKTALLEAPVSSKQPASVPLPVPPSGQLVPPSAPVPSSGPPVPSRPEPVSVSPATTRETSDFGEAPQPKRPPSSLLAATKGLEEKHESAAPMSARSAALKAQRTTQKSVEELMEQAKNFVCRSCSTPVPLGHKFCGRCGAAVPPEIMSARTQFFGQLQAPGKAKLILIRGEGVEGLSYQLNAEQHVVGKNGQLVFPDDPFVSPRHANFFYRNGTLCVKDEGSTNGVYLRVRGTIDIATDDYFLAGEQVFRFNTPPNQNDSPGPDGTYFYSSPKQEARFRVTQILQGGPEGMVVCARQPSLQIGREGGDLNFPTDLYMSGKHCKIEEKDSMFKLTDLGSRNGTYIRLKQERELGHGDYLFIGRKLLRVEITAA